MPDPETFAVWLKRRQRQLDLTRKALAQRANCSVSTLRRLEAGDLRPSKDLAEQLARALEVVPQDREAFVQFARGISTHFLYLASTQVASSTRSSPNSLTRLPAPLTRFVGRKSEVDAVCELLRQPGVRLLTLTGPPGVGKTRLSLATAQALAADRATLFPDGAHFVSLAPITDPALVISVIARTLGVREPPQAGHGETNPALQEFLQDKRLLLVLDNFEQVVPAAPIVTQLLTAAPGVKALVTSREILHVYGEHEYPVPALPFPDVQRLPTTFARAFYTRYASLQLFQERARAVRHDFRISPENAAAVAGICAWLDGLPLAIEMTAAQTKWLSPAALLTQLSHRLATLVPGPRDLGPRQQTLRGAIDWSYDLLTPEERRVFAALSVFRGGCTVEAAAHVLNETDMATIRALLRALMDKSLLSGEFGGADGERGESESIGFRHAEFFLEMARVASDALKGGATQREWLDRLEREYNNLCAALEWFAAHEGSSARLCELVCALEEFWRIRGYLTEGRRWSGLAVAHAPESSPSRGTALNAASGFATRQGDYSSALRYAEQALAIFESVQDKKGKARSLHQLGHIAGRQGYFQEAEVLFRQALVLARECGEVYSVATILNDLGIALQRQKKWSETEAVYQECLSERRAPGDRSGTASALNGLAGIYWELEDLPRAMETLAESLALKHSLGDRIGLVASLQNAARLALAQDNPEQAALLYGAGIHLRIETGHSDPPYLHAEKEREIAAIRARLEESTFNAAWHAGESQSIDEILHALIGRTKK